MFKLSALNSWIVKSGISDLTTKLRLIKIDTFNGISSFISDIVRYYIVMSSFEI